VPVGVEDGTTTVRIEVPVPLDVTVTLFGLRAGAGPDGKTEAERNTVFEKPLMLPRLIVAVPDCPAGTGREEGLALMLKSTTLTVIVTE
jgi:hypothetical protein